MTRAELFEILPAAMAAWGREGNAGFRSWLELYFAERDWPVADRIEQGGEGRAR